MLFKLLLEADNFTRNMASSAIVSIVIACVAVNFSHFYLIPVYFHELFLKHGHRWTTEKYCATRPYVAPLKIFFTFSFGMMKIMNALHAEIPKYSH